jgi:hypothetical protein
LGCGEAGEGFDMTAREYLKDAERFSRQCREDLLRASLKAGEEDNSLLQYVLQQHLAEARALEGKLVTLINLTAP